MTCTSDANLCNKNIYEKAKVLKGIYSEIASTYPA